MVTQTVLLMVWGGEGGGLRQGLCFKYLCIAVKYGSGNLAGRCVSFLYFDVIQK
jgi:hypothetical protein